MSKTIIITEDVLNSMISGHRNFSNIKRKYINKIAKGTQDLTSHIYRDNDWRNVNVTFNRIREIIGDDGELEVNVKNGGYGKSSDGMAQYKEYHFNVYLNVGIKFNGVLTCHAAGSQNDPFGKYDMTIQMW